MMMVMVEQDRLMEHMWREVFALNNNHGRPGNEVATRLLMDLSRYESESVFLNFLQSRRGDSSKTGFARKEERVGEWGQLPRGLRELRGLRSDPFRILVVWYYNR